MQELVDQLLTYLKSTWRYRWFAVGVAWLIASAGWIVVDGLPDHYEARARVQVDTQSVLRPLLSGLAVQPNTAQIVSMLSRTLISRPNMEKVIQMAGLDTNLKSPRDREQLISRLVNEVKMASADRENFYTISYLAPNPEEGNRVVQALITLFEQESLSDKRKDSEAARSFIEDQLKIYGEKLKAAEKAVMDFKRKNVGLMPGEGRGYYAELRDAEVALREARLELREAENSRNAIKQQLESYSVLPSSQGDEDAARGFNPELDARINAFERKLDNLLVTYTDQHPDVVALVRLISHLKEQRVAEAKLMTTTRSGTKTLDLGQQQLIVSLSSAEAKVAAINARVAGHDRRYRELKAVANALPQIEAEYTQLTRDNQVVQSRYNRLLERRESARISGDMEEKSDVMGFRVVDPPRVSPKPTSPNRPRLVSMVLLAALGVGCGLAFLIGQLRPTFDDERRLREFSGLPVLGTVVMERTGWQKARRRGGLVALIVSFSGLLSAYAAIMMSLVLTASRA